MSPAAVQTQSDAPSGLLQIVQGLLGIAGLDLVCGLFFCPRLIFHAPWYVVRELYEVLTAVFFERAWVALQGLRATAKLKRPAALRKETQESD